MAVIRVCDKCSKELTGTMYMLQSTSMEMCESCFNLAREELKKAEALVESMTRPTEIEPPLGYHVYFDDYMFPDAIGDIPQQEVMKQKIDLLYQLTPGPGELEI